MKKTKATWTFIILQIIFLFVAPCIMIWVQYGDLTQGYKISVTAIMLILLMFFIFKKIFLDKWLKTFEQKLINIETTALTITDDVAIASNKKAWRDYSIMQLIFNSIIPLLLMVLAVVTIKTVQEGLIKLYGCLMFCLISVVIGVIFKVGEIYSMKLTHEKVKEETDET